MGKEGYVFCDAAYGYEPAVLGEQEGRLPAVGLPASVGVSSAGLPAGGEPVGLPAMGQLGMWRPLALDVELAGVAALMLVRRHDEAA